MKDKYYTPTKEEFYIGFECDIYDEDDRTWDTVYIDTQPSLCNITGLSLDIRVKYLDKDDIEDLGFSDYKRSVCNWYKLEGRFEDSFASYGYWSKIRLIHCSDNNVIKILAYEYSWDEEENVLYAGKCKNKSELKVLLKQLNIL